VEPQEAVVRDPQGAEQRGGARCRRSPRCSTSSNKDALTWWGMGVGVQGVLTLVNIGLLSSPQRRRTGPACSHALAPQAGPDQPRRGRQGVPGQVEAAEAVRSSRPTTSATRRATAASPCTRRLRGVGQVRASCPSRSCTHRPSRGTSHGLRRFIEESGAKPVGTRCMVGSVKARLRRSLRRRHRVPTGRRDRRPPHARPGRAARSCSRPGVPRRPEDVEGRLRLALQAARGVRGGARSSAATTPPTRAAASSTSTPRATTSASRPRRRSPTSRPVLNEWKQQKSLAARKKEAKS
jgi:hypothetical protein